MKYGLRAAVAAAEPEEEAALGRIILTVLVINTVMRASPETVEKAGAVIPAFRHRILRQAIPEVAAVRAAMSTMAAMPERQITECRRRIEMISPTLNFLMVHLPMARPLPTPLTTFCFRNISESTFTAATVALVAKLGREDIITRVHHIRLLIIPPMEALVVLEEAVVALG
jgi:hypothetical protein